MCDGCALGVAGFHDWTIDGVHLCMTRLNLLRLNTMPALDARVLEDVASLKRLSNDELRELGRLPYPDAARERARGFRRISWDDAYARIAQRHSRAATRTASPSSHLARRDQRNLLRGAKGGALPRHQQRRQRRAALSFAFDRRDEARARRRRQHLQLQRLVRHGSDRLLRRQPRQRSAGRDEISPRSEEARHEVVLVNPYREPGMERYWVPSIASSALFGTDIMDYWFPGCAGRRHRVPLRRAENPDRERLA